MIIDLPDGVLLQVYVQPRGKKTEIVGTFGEPPRLKLRLAAPPVDGKANDELIRFFANQLNCTQKDVLLLRGQSSRMKDVQILGVSHIEAIQLLGLETSISNRL